MRFPGRVWTATACATFIALGLAALVLSLPGYRPRDFLARRIESRIGALPETEVLIHVRRMTSLGDEGVTATVKLLASDRAVEAEAAEVALNEQLDAWRLLPRDDSLPRALHLAEELAALTPELSPRRRRFAAELATQLLLWPVTDTDDAEKLLTHCEQTLRAGARGSSDASPPPAILASPPLLSLPRR
ncbi:MAG: hypothetical protein KY475_18205 [Planctomycetes bacterium]|nr:hypothetical protein [Planctomycetota bacterium]